MYRENKQYRIQFSCIWVTCGAQLINTQQNIKSLFFKVFNYKSETKPITKADGLFKSHIASLSSMWTPHCRDSNSEFVLYYKPALQKAARCTFSIDQFTLMLHYWLSYLLIFLRLCHIEKLNISSADTAENIGIFSFNFKGISALSINVHFHIFHKNVLQMLP